MPVIIAVKASSSPACMRRNRSPSLHSACSFIVSFEEYVTPVAYNSASKGRKFQNCARRENRVGGAIPLWAEEPVSAARFPLHTDKFSGNDGRQRRSHPTLKSIASATGFVRGNHSCGKRTEFCINLIFGIASWLTNKKPQISLRVSATALISSLKFYEPDCFRSSLACFLANFTSFFALTSGLSVCIALPRLMPEPTMSAFSWLKGMPRL